MITRPGVVSFASEERYPLHLSLVDSGSQQRFHLFRTWMNDKQRFALADGIGHLDVSLGDFFQIVLPVGGGMWPSELNKSLWFPFGGHSPFFHVGKDTNFSIK